MVLGVEEGGFGCGRGGEVDGEEDLWVLGGGETKVVKYKGEGTGVRAGWWKVVEGRAAKREGGVDLTDKVVIVLVYLHTFCFSYFYCPSLFLFLFLTFSPPFTRKLN